MAPVTVSSIFCDQIRREDNGKFFFVGVYPDEMMINAGPAVYEVQPFIHVGGLSIGTHDAQISIERHQDGEISELAAAGVEMGINKEGHRIGIPLPTVPFDVTSDFEISVTVSVDGAAPLLAGSLFVVAAFANLEAVEQKKPTL